jgi:hypothetical protein
MLALSADNLVFKMLRSLTKIVILVPALDRFGLTMLIVQVMSHRYFRADIEEREFITVVTVKTRGFVVKALEVRINYKNLNVFMNGICKYQICCSQRNFLFICEVLVAGPLRGLCLRGGGGGCKVKFT